MRDSEEHYPFRQSGGDKEPHQHLDPLADHMAEEEEEEPLRRGGGPLHQREVATTPELPHGRFVRALIIGVVAGLLCSAQAIIVTIANSSSYQQLSKTPASQAGNLALTLAGFACLTFFLSILICVVAGFITGKVAVERRLGFLGGFVAGVIYYAIAVFLVRYIPSYPGNLPATGGGNVAGITGGIVVSLVFLVVLGAIGGLCSFLGAWIATRRHPYYVGY